MSYNVVFCQSPISSVDREAWKQMDSLIEQQGDVPAIFYELISKLTEKYPCICDLSDDEVDDGVWSDGPLRNNAGHKAIVLGMMYSSVDEVLPFLIQTANALHLVALDPGSESIHRP